MDGSFEFSTIGHPQTTHQQPNAAQPSSSYFQSSFARSLSFNNNQSQSLDFELSFRIAGKSSESIVDCPAAATAVDDDDVENDATIVMSSRRAASSPPPPALPASDPPSATSSMSSTSAGDTTVLLISPNAATTATTVSSATASPPSTPPSATGVGVDGTRHNGALSPSPLLTPKQKNGRIYLPSSTPKRRYTTLLTNVRAAAQQQECQSLIEDNRRLISATDRQARGRDSLTTASDQYFQQHQQQQHHQPHHQPPHQRQTPQPTTTARVAGSTGGCSGGCISNISNSSAQKSTVETVVLQTQIDTLQWQLKQVESSRQMYHAVMEEVVRFLDRCHQTLNVRASGAGQHPGGLHLNSKLSAMARSKSVNQVFVPNDTSSLLNETVRGPAGRGQRTGTSRAVGEQHQQVSKHAGNGKHHLTTTAMMMNSLDENLDMSAVPAGRLSDAFAANYKDLTWRRSPKHAATIAAANASDSSSDSAKLSQEAFRLLRTAQNLLNLKEPVLAEPPKPPMPKPNTATPASNHQQPPAAQPQLQRKSHCRDSRLSMQSSTDDSVHSTTSSSSSSSSTTSSRLETDDELLLGFVSSGGGRSHIASSSAAAPFGGGLHASASTASASSTCSSGTSSSASANHAAANRGSSNVHHSNSNGGGRVSSADDESGFSSMSSFQDIGLPITAAAMPPQLPPRSRLSTASTMSTTMFIPQGASSLSSTDEEAAAGFGGGGGSSTMGRSTTKTAVGAIDGGAQRPLACHRRWSSTPAPPVPPKRQLSTFVGTNDDGCGGEPLRVLWV